MSRDLAIDLGTANTLLLRRDEGIVFDQPTAVAIDLSDGHVEAIGTRAWDVLGGPFGSIVVQRPLRAGAITDFETTRAFVEAVLHEVGMPRFPRARAVLGIPFGSSAVERRALEQAVGLSGVGLVTLVDEPLAAAVGAGLPVSDAVGSMIVDVGGGTTQAAILSLGGIISGHCTRVGGFDLDEAIQASMEKHHGVRVADATAERIKIEVGTAFPVGDGRSIVVEGRDLASGASREVRVTEDEVRAAIVGPVSRITDAVRRTLSDAPPELVHDVLETGMFLTGGTALLTGLDLRISEECEIAVHRADRPLETVVLGAGSMLDQVEGFRLAFSLPRRR